MSKKSTIAAVTGLGRCGTSMTMQMLVAGGMEHLSMGPPLYDTLQGLDLPGETAWLGEARGKAVKLLRSDVFAPPKRDDWRWIWLERDTVQQTASVNKLFRALGRPAVDESCLAQAASRSRANIKAAGGRMLRLRFEEVLGDPCQAAGRIASHLGRPLDLEAMAAVVHGRGTACAGGLEFDADWLAGEINAYMEKRNHV